MCSLFLAHIKVPCGLWLHLIALPSGTCGLQGALTGKKRDERGIWILNYLGQEVPCHLHLQFIGQSQSHDPICLQGTMGIAGEHFVSYRGGFIQGISEIGVI